MLYFLYGFRDLEEGGGGDAVKLQLGYRAGIGKLNNKKHMFVLSKVAGYRGFLRSSKKSMAFSSTLFWEVFSERIATLLECFCDGPIRLIKMCS